MDETGISTVPNRTPKVIAPKGKKKTDCTISSTERGQTVTSVCCMSATGVFVPPALILPRKRMNLLLYKDATNGTLPLISDTGKGITLYKVSGILQKAYSATARVQLAEKASRVTCIEPNNPDIISEDCYSASLATIAPLDNDCAVAVVENEVSPSASQIDVSIQSILPLPRHEQGGAKRKRKSQKSEIMTSSPFKNLLEKNEKEKVELEEAKTNRVFKKNKNGGKTKK
ncbi:hypothetical protein AVEN_99166-1 [Araneus ventricosus]|uniref:DDE-1 domain-containing protein n=1 Tax=Araneus ventricosus TaxID=182803 RepID=A0A4Y2CHQ2_ARAVE|nr:hypothetical protein AVEN_99166-1 [Araneus ventricosus]